jgi:heterodisulfide reductase subunit A-like polyferredoxin
VADDDRLRRAQRVEHANHVADEMKQRVLIDGFRPACLAIAAHVGRDGAIAGLVEGEERVRGHALLGSLARQPAFRAGHHGRSPFV